MSAGADQLSAHVNLVHGGDHGLPASLNAMSGEPDGLPAHADGVCRAAAGDELQPDWIALGLGGSNG